MDSSAYDEAINWLEEKYTAALDKHDQAEMLLIEWIIDKLYFDNDMRNS